MTLPMEREASPPRVVVHGGLAHHARRGQPYAVSSLDRYRGADEITAVNRVARRRLRGTSRAYLAAIVAALVAVSLAAVAG